MKKRILSLVMATALSVTMLAGCNSKTESPAAPDNQPAAAEEPAESDATEGEANGDGGEELVLKLAMTSSNDLTKPAVEIFTSHIEENIPRVKFDIYINGELYTNAEDLQAAVSEGIVDVSLEGDMAMSWASPEWLSWTSVPFAFNSKEQAKKFFTGEAGDEINEILISDYNMRFFNNEIGVRGGRMITANKPIYSPDDLKGVKMRTPNVIGTVASWEAMGATVINVAWGDLFNALQTGVVEAEENPYLELDSGGFYQVQKYIMETSHQIGPQVIWMNEATFQKFTPQEQEVILEANKLAFENYNSNYEANDEKLKQKFLDNGNIIIPAEEIDLDAFRQIVLDNIVNGDVSKDYKEGGWDYIQSLAE
ncbi:MAG: TRAP transporter substrate-binding protein [Lachnospiraceae bacterium]|jgi:TRAP-type C4-dicarboxylate transport system substrate-binding protein|nr:TRAP transporter substrate-binding protein [Lachnospiraceae bacterium]MCI9681149.1 TRAP transporter substrate-binding protein [Lachnospiraceae bacterium]